MIRTLKSLGPIGVARVVIVYAGIAAFAAMVMGGCTGKLRNPIDATYEHLAAKALADGHEAMLARDYAAADRYYGRALSFQPDLAEAHAGAGRVAEVQGDLSAAIGHFRSAVKNAPDSSAYALALGDAILRQAVTSMNRNEMIEAALRSYRHGLAVDERCAKAAIGIGMCHRVAGRIDLAIESYKHAQRIDDASAEPHVLLAAAYESRSQYNRAMREYRLALKLAPEDPKLHNACAAMNARLAQHGGPSERIARQRALAHYRRSLELDPEQPRVREAMAMIEPATRTWMAGGNSNGE